VARSLRSTRGGKAPILVAVVLALAGGGFVTYRTLAKPRAEPGDETPAAKPIVLDPGIVDIEPFVLNLADPAGDRFFRLNLRLVLDQRSVAQRFGTGISDARLRDRLLTILAKKRVSDLTTPEGKERLRHELGTAADGLLTEKPYFDSESDPAPARVIDVLFTEFLVQ
jgi:flagellar FliL protein